MLALVTRPEPQASAWVQALREAGVAAQSLPLIAITGPAQAEPVKQAWHGLARFKALMFVSPAAVEWFFKLRPDGVNWPEHTLAAAPGPGTAKQLFAAGQAAGLNTTNVITPADDAPQFDSETLWPCLANMDWQQQHVCIISGGDQQEAKGRTWLMQQWRSHGATVQTLLTYQRGPAMWTADQQALAKQALAHPQDHIWLISSSEALDFLSDTLLPPLESTPYCNWPAVHALVTHPKIAERAQSLGIGHVIQTRPNLDEVVQALRSGV